MNEANFKGSTLVFADNLLMLSRENASQLAENVGARVQKYLSSRVDYLVTGSDGLLVGSGGRVSKVVKRAHQLRELYGRPLLVSEQVFLRFVGAEQIVARHRYRYTLSQLSRILGIPSETLRRWLRRGLIEPVAVVNRLPWFDFAGLSRARRLKELREAGVELRRIENAFRQLAEWYPSEESGLSRIEPMCAAPIIRLPDGTLSDPSGQRLLDFATVAPVPESVRLIPFVDHGGEDSERWFETGVKAEDEGDLESALEAYEKALLSGGPDAEICFNLGNVLVGLEREAEAVQRYLQAVESEPYYVEAWNNLGIALDSIGQVQEAIASFLKALETEPRYGEAHFNLAEVLEQIGRGSEARKHWLAYLEEDPDSPVAREVEDRLRKG